MRKTRNTIAMILWAPQLITLVTITCQVIVADDQLDTTQNMFTDITSPGAPIQLQRCSRAKGIPSAALTELQVCWNRQCHTQVLKPSEEPLPQSHPMF